MTDDVKTKLKEQSKLTKKFYKNGNMKSDFDKVIAISNECTEAISAAKDKYIKQAPQKTTSFLNFETIALLHSTSLTEDPNAIDRILYAKLKQIISLRRKVDCD